MKCGREKESKGRYISVAEIVREAVREFLDKKRESANPLKTTDLSRDLDQF